MDNLSIGQFIRKMENDYISGTSHISRYVNFSQYNNIEKIDAYLNSKHISGEFDAMHREKPFFNIVTGAVNVWYRATDIDRKDIAIKATKQKDYVAAFLATIHLQEFMRRDKFGQFLNEWGRSLARYGSSVVKFVIKNGRLHAEVSSWNRIISDAIDFESNPVIEKLYLTPAQLRQNKSYDQEAVKNLLTALTQRKGVGRETKDNRQNYIELYEIHGLMPKSYLTGKETDKDEFVQQMQVLSFVKQDEKDDDSYLDFALVKGREKQSPYMITHLIKEDGRSQGIGAVEYLFEAQWMENHTVKSIKDQLDLASKLIFQTQDESFVGKNMLTAIENGDILIHAENSPLTNIANNSHDIQALQAFGQQWKTLAQELTSTPDAIQGNTMPSGTAYKQTQMLNQEAHSLFDLMTQNKGLAIEDMMRTFIIPYLKTQMNNSKEVAATLSAQSITQIDSMYINAEVNRRLNKHIKKHMLNENGAGGQVAPPFDIQGEQQKIQQDLQQTGNQRFLAPSDVPTKTWIEAFKDLEWNVEVEVTGETTDKAAVLTTLTTVLQTVVANPQMLQDPNAKMLFNKILETTGVVSPVEINEAAQPVTPSFQPAGAQAVLAGGAPAGGGQPAPQQ